MLWTDPKITFYGTTMVKIKIIVTGWRITIQVRVMTANLMNNKLQIVCNVLHNIINNK